MKLVKIAGSLSIVFLCLNMQSMELPMQYPLEEQLLDRSITIRDYLSLLEKSSNYYGYRLRDMRMAAYAKSVYNLYDLLVMNISYSLASMRFDISGGMKMGTSDRDREIIKKQYVEKILPIIRQGIIKLYGNLQEYVLDGRARITKEI